MTMAPHCRCTMEERLGGHLYPDCPYHKGLPEPKFLDGELVLWVDCPECGLHALLDDDQAHGRVSTDCPECPYHETVNWWAMLPRHMERLLKEMHAQGASDV